MATTYLDQATFGPWTNLASASTADLGSVQANAVNITGTTTITSFGTGASLLRFVKFAGALTLTHNATSLILPTGANITTVAGDTCTALSDGSGNWTVVNYQRASGAALVAAGSSGNITYNASGTSAGMSGTSWDDTNRSLTLTGATVTSSKPIIDATQTWNSSGVTFTGLKVNVTNTASASASMLIDLQLGGASAFSVRRDGMMYNGAGNTGTALTTAGFGRWYFGGDSFGDTSSSAIFMGTDTTVLQFRSSGKLGFSDSSTNAASTLDTLFARAAAKVVSVEGASSTGGTFRHIATTPSQITADQNNYAPGGTSKFQRWSTDAARNITGLSLSQVDGQEHMIVNVGSNNIVLVHQSASSTAANRFLNSTGADITLSANQSAELVYDNTQSRWLVYKRN